MTAIGGALVLMSLVVARLASIALAARYGFNGSDTELDGASSAVVFGSIALCACVFDALAVRLWFQNHRKVEVGVGLIALAAFVVTFTNSLGAIASRADVTQAERAETRDERASDRTELKRVLDERAAMGAANHRRRGVSRDRMAASRRRTGVRAVPEVISWSCHHDSRRLFSG